MPSRPGSHNFRRRVSRSAGKRTRGKKGKRSNPFREADSVLNFRNQCPADTRHGQQVVPGTEVSRKVPKSLDPPPELRPDSRQKFQFLRRSPVHVERSSHQEASSFRQRCKHKHLGARGRIGPHENLIASFQWGLESSPGQQGSKTGRFSFQDKA